MLVIFGLLKTVFCNRVTQWQFLPFEKTKTLEED